MESKDFLKDFPPGPLDEYRNQASFNWKVMKRALEDEEIIRFKYWLWNIMEHDTLFARSPVDLSLDDHREITMLRTLKIEEICNAKYGTLSPIFRSAMIMVLGQYDWSVAGKWLLIWDILTNSVRGLGTERHDKFLEAAEKRELTAAFCLTEIAHGSNTSGMRTTATYDPTKQVFILNSPDFEAAKCWAGCLGKTATHAVVFAKLITPYDGDCGLHSFIVPIRDTKTLHLFPGVLAGDMGSKLGLNGIDNGFVMFEKYEIPRENLLNKTGDVDVDGRYITPYKDPKKRLGASLGGGGLSTIRVGVVLMAAANFCNAIPIAIRYSALRRQFGSDEKETPVIEYQLQQWRLFPFLSAAYALKVLGESLIRDMMNMIVNQMTGEGSPESRSIASAEMHALSSSAKPFSGWLARDCIQECRECCGGHGYLKASGISQLRNDNDPNLTFEGENNVLLQQTSNFLLNLWTNENMKKISYAAPLGSINFLPNAQEILKKKCTYRPTLQDIMKPEFILDAYKWLICSLLEKTSRKFQSHLESGRDQFDAKNNTQIYFARTLALVYIEHFCIERFHQFSTEPRHSPEISDVLKKLVLLYGLWTMEKQITNFYTGGYFEGPEFGTLVRECILDICLQIKPEAVALCDSLAPPDFVLNSVIGHSNGQLYKNLKNSMQQTPGCLERPDWWRNAVEYMRKNSKL